jgi:hypothetical protein
MTWAKATLVVLVLAGTTGCNAVGRTIFMAAVVTAAVVQTAAEMCAQEDVDCSAPAPSGGYIEIRETRDPYSAAVDW